MQRCIMARNLSPRYNLKLAVTSTLYTLIRVDTPLNRRSQRFVFCRPPHAVTEAKTARAESPNAAPATKTARTKSPNAAPARKNARAKSPNAARAANLQEQNHEMLHLP